MELGLTSLTFLVWHVGLVVQTKTKKRQQKPHDRTLCRPFLLPNVAFGTMCVGEYG